MASDLISRDALAEELSTLTMYITGLRAGKGVLNEFMQEYRKSVLRIVEEAPAVDAVEVVRCMNCAHKRNEGPILRCPFSTVDLIPGGFCEKGYPNVLREVLQNIKKMEKKKRVFEEGGWEANETEKSGEGVRE